MAPDDYLRAYTEPLHPLQSSMAGDSSPAIPGDREQLLIAGSFYYPPHFKLESYLDAMNLSDLLAIVQEILAIEDAEKRLTRRKVIEYLESVRRIKEELEWRRPEMDRLTAELAERETRIGRLTADLERLTTDLEQQQFLLAQLEGDNAVLRGNLADLYASTSWKVTAPLRRLSRLLRTALSGRN